MMTSGQAYKRLGAVLLIFACLALAHSIWLPLHEAPDEVAHFLYARFIAQTGRLPLNYEERSVAGYKAGWPALYQVIVAGLTGWKDSNDPPYLKFVWQSPRFDMAKELLYTKRLANTEDETTTYQGTVLMWHLARLVSIGLSMFTIVVVFFTALEIFPKNYWLALICAAIIAFVPIFVFISSAISDDSLVALLVGLYFLLLIKTIKRDTQLNFTLWKNYVGLGVLMGLAVTTKYSTVILPVQILGVVGYWVGFGRMNWLNGLKRVVVVAVAAIVASSWWFLTLILYFNEIEQYGPLIGLLKPIIASETDVSQRYVAFVLTGGAIGIKDSPEFISEPFWQWMVTIYQSFWVRQIENYPLGPVAQILIGAACVIAVVGLIRAWRRHSARRVWLVLLVTHILLFLIFPFLRQVIQGNVSQTAQGRHVLFPTATVVPLLLVFGWQGWFSIKTQRRLALALVGGLLCWSMVQLIRVIDYPILYLPIRTTAEAAAAIPHRLDQNVGDYLVLRGYDLETTPADGALKLKLYWQATDYVDEDYLMIVKLIQDEQSVFSWTFYPLNALYPTRIWESWEIIRDDVWLPLTDLSPGTYHLQIQLQNIQGTFLPVGTDNKLVLDEITVPAELSTQPDIPLTLAVDGRTVVSGVTIWQAERYRRFDLPEYQPRMQIPFLWQGQTGPSEQVDWLLVDPVGEVYPATRISEHFGYFTVGLDWPSGDYRLRAELWRDGQVIGSTESQALVTIINKKPRLLEPPPITYPMEANFDNRIKLLGYELPVRAIAAGEVLPVTLYWQGLRTMGQSYTLFAKLLDNQHNSWTSVDRFPADGYQTYYWLEDEVVVDGFELPVDPTVPNGVYWLNIGFYEEIDGVAVSLPLVVSGERTDVTSLTFGPVKVGDAPTGMVASNINPEQTLAVDFGEVIRLRGYDLSQTEHNLDVTLYWENLAPTNRDYTVFVHVRNQAGETVAQMDRPPQSGAYPTSLWAPGELISDEIAIPLPLEMSPGEYDVVVGLYDFATGARLPVSGSSNDSITLTKIAVPTSVEMIGAE